ncbi:hypothetical protein DFP72DRAFT_1163405 [Ephemerocybe angulata]|uniref:Uncharacterized protein n=1 Tax=Ephemerocybe angulata TaxID=980116 RepID=A0A8H6IHU2_9AGAR|nr:hypothetical protein DFP72DRAFT_1163405 [Tulosesus angulatus]
MGRATLTNGLFAIAARVVSNQLDRRGDRLVHRSFHCECPQAWPGPPHTRPHPDLLRKQHVPLHLGASGALQEGIDLPSLPLGWILSAFLISMTLGSLACTIPAALFTRSPGCQANRSAGVTSGGGGSSLTVFCKVEQPSRSLRTLNSDKKSRCLVFCPFEACLEIYFPVQGVLRGALISNEHRVIVPSLLHIPLNIFVVAVLMKGVSSARYAIPTPHLLEPYDWPCRPSTVVVSRTETHAGHPSPQ